jgi:hypothetical protein
MFGFISVSPNPDGLISLRFEKLQPTMAGDGHFALAKCPTNHPGWGNPRFDLRLG